MVFSREIEGYVSPEFRAIVQPDGNIRSLTDVIYGMAAEGGEQPDEAIHSLPGALRGETPLSKGEAVEKEIK